MPPTFAHLGVPETICRALERQGITAPFEIQSASLTDGLTGRDICGHAPTGSGKTLAYGIPLVARVDRADPRKPRALILAPTRELAEQIKTEIRTFAGPIRIGVVYGGVGYPHQIRALRQGLDILVACPGRLEDLIEQGAVNLSAVDHVVVDEADRMADMGFMPAVRRLLDQTCRKRQTMLFSATLDSDVAKLTHHYQQDPVRHEVGNDTPDITAAHHVFWNVAKVGRTKITAEAVHAVSPALIFCRTRRGSDRLARQLGEAGVQVSMIHGGRSQNQRTRALADFSDCRLQALVATDVAARGIHVERVASVIHYDPPEDHKAYLHRSGRTARAGHGGVVVSLVQPDQVRDLRRMQHKMGLDEPFTAPNTSALVDLSPEPTRVRVLAKAPNDGDAEQTAAGTGRRTNPSVHARRNRGTASAPRGDRLNTRNRRKAGHAGRGGRSQERSGPPRLPHAGGGAPNRKARRAHLQPRASE